MEQEITLREVRLTDLAVFFEMERDPVSVQRAAFAAKDPEDRDAFDQHWQKVLADPTVQNRTILYRGEVVGYVACFELLGLPSVGYWIDRGRWGRGIATRALQLFLSEVTLRPVYARVVHDNIASQRVLERCNFVRVGTDRAFANARGAEVEEQLWRLGGVAPLGGGSIPRRSDE